MAHLSKGGTALLLKLLTECHQQVLAGDPHAVGEGVLVLVLHEAVWVLAPLGALLLRYLFRGNFHELQVIFKSEEK